MNLDWSAVSSAVRELFAEFSGRLPYLLVGMVVLLAFLLLGKAVGAALKHLAKRQGNHYELGLVLGRLGQGAVILLGLLVALVIAVPGFTPSRLIGLLGLSSVAIGFAFKDILQNFLAGILILLSHRFRIGDQIVIGDYEGTIEAIETRASFIRTYDGRLVVIPNSKLLTETVTVNTAADKRRLQYDFGIGYGDDIAAAKRVALEALRGAPGLVDEPAPDVLVVELAESSVNLRLRWWIHPPRRLDLLISQDEVLGRVKKALVEAGIDLPFPTRQILFHDQTEAGDADRGRQREGWPKGPEEAPGQARVVDAVHALRARGDPGSTGAPEATRKPG